MQPEGESSTATYPSQSLGTRLSAAGQKVFLLAKCKYNPIVTEFTLHFYHFVAQVLLGEM